MDLATNFPAPDVPDLPHRPDPPEVFDSAAGTIECIPLSASGTHAPAIPAFDSLPACVPHAFGTAGPVLGRLSFSAAGEPAGVARDPRQAEAMRRDPDAGFDPRVLAALAAEPAAQHELERLQAQTNDALFAAIDEVRAMLAPEATRRSSTPSPTGPTHIRALMVAQRQGEILGNDRRELAEGIVMGSLLNLDNPHWNPADPATCQAEPQSALLALLGMGS
jgi:hypothetical protein